MTRRIIAVHPDRCLGCKTCELYCAAERGSDGQTVYRAVKEEPRPRPRVRVEGRSGFSAAIQCRHCRQAPCLDACLTGALQRDEATGLVLVDEARCIGCWTCTMFCPYGVIYPWPERGFALKCDRCAHLEEPVCVAVCPTRALEVVAEEDLSLVYAPRRRTAARALAGALPEGGSAALDWGPPAENNSFSGR